MVDADTVSAVVSGLVHHRIIEPADALAVGAQLVTANRAHVAARYGEKVDGPGVVIRIRPVADPIELLTRLDCLRYSSDPAMLPGMDLETLREATIRRLPGYGDGRWWR